MKTNNVALLDQNAANGGENFTAKSKLSIDYLELPVNFLYNMPVKGGKFFIGGGPYLAYGLSGKGKTTEIITSNGNTTTTYSETNSNFGSEGLRRFDFGLGALGGFELNNGISISAGFEHDLTNIEQSGTNNTKNEVFMASVGYTIF
ncbi:outer membrane beta-barrel protein [Mucilaginibacter sp.]